MISSTDGFTEAFVKGIEGRFWMDDTAKAIILEEMKQVYIPLDFEKSLMELPLLDRISQMMGDWRARLEDGLLISGEDFDL